MKSAAYWIEKLELQQHPEGGWFKEIYRSDDVVPESGCPVISKGNANFQLLSIFCSKAMIFLLFTALSPMNFHELKGRIVPFLR